MPFIENETKKQIHKVPLWLAVALKKVHRCKIIPPRWLTLDRLRFFISSETDNEEQLHDIPFHFFEVASLLLHHAPDDMDDAPKVRRYVEDLANARDSKMRRWMQAHVRDRVNAVKINHLTLHEIHVHRPILTEILDDLYAIHVKPDALASQSESQQPPQQQQGTPSNSQTPTAGGGQQQGSALRRGGPVDSAEDASTTTGEPQGQGHRLRRVIRGNT